MQVGGVQKDRAGVPALAEAVAQSASEPMLVLDIEGRIAFANAAAESLLCAPIARLRGTHVDRHVSGVLARLGDARAAGPGDPIDSDGPEWVGPQPRLSAADAPDRPVGIRLSGAAADGHAFVCVSIRPQAPSAPEDGRRLAERAFVRLSGAPAGGGGVIVIDVDHFELVNQSLGRAKGDLVLADLELALNAIAAGGEVAAHLEADRFALVTSHAQPERRADEVLEEIRSRRIEIGGTTLRLTASAGVCTHAEAGPNGERALLIAEGAAQTAKEQGRDRCVLGTRAATRNGALGVSWNDRIRTGIESGGLTPHLQPILDLSNGRISHYELLARLHDRNGELIAPSIFIPIAERLGMVGAIDRWAIRTAVHVLARWTHSPRGPRIAVNASGRSIGASQLLDTVHRELSKDGVPASKLIIEVTETAAIGSIEAAAEFGEELRRLGVGFALDDFGSGFGTFLYLKHLPLDQVKIDGEFIQGISASTADQAFVRSLVEMARGLGMKTVAEFVADEAALDCVRKLGIDYAQGYLIGPPRPLMDTAAAR